MMAGNPNWWSINTMHPQSRQLPSGYHESFPQYLYGSSPNLADHNHDPGQEYPRSWSQLLIGGLANDDQEETLLTGSPNYEIKKVEQNWEGQNLNPCLTGVNDYGSGDDVKLENSLIYGGGVVDEFQVVKPCWSQVIMPASSPSSSVTCLSSNLLNFSTTTSKFENRNHHPETSSECNSSKAASVAKKPKIQHSTTQTSLKVRKEKLGDRITSLHQLVSPFGKTDTASVLSESVGYIRFLQAQIQALSSPYLGNIASRSNDSEDKPKDLKSRGLCLVPVSCTIHVASDNGADYWAPPPPGRGF